MHMMISSFILRNTPDKLYMSHRQLSWQNQFMESVKDERREETKKRLNIAF